MNNNKTVDSSLSNTYYSKEWSTKWLLLLWYH